MSIFRNNKQRNLLPVDLLDDLEKATSIKERVKDQLAKEIYAPGRMEINSFEWAQRMQQRQMQDRTSTAVFVVGSYNYHIP